MPRKTPYSGKQKKQQLKEKKVRKQDGPKYLADWSEDEENQDKNKVGSHSSYPSKTSGLNQELECTSVHRINAQPERKSKSSSNVNNFRLQFLKEPDDVVEKRKRAARMPTKHLHEDDLEYSIQEVYPSNVRLDFPKRPPWNYGLSREKLDSQENKYFQGYLADIISQPDAENLSYFELNLENWRQLWRVIEISDILLVIADIRYPVLHIPPSLVDYVQRILHKPVIVVLNKIDFVPTAISVAWKRYLQKEFPGVYVVFFSSFVSKFPTEDNDDIPQNFDPSKAMFRKPKKGSTTTIGSAELYKAVLDIVGDKIDLSTWRQQLEKDGLLSSASSDLLCDQVQGLSECGPSNGSEDIEVKGNNDDLMSEKGRMQECDKHKIYKDGMVTIGCIGYPNVGKSSVLNAIKGKKVVSVSQTPGHTKHLQTIFITPTVQLCDCPGLVFPSVVPRSLQVIAGIFPVAQVREPYSVVQYLAERINLPELLKIRRSGSSDSNQDECVADSGWSAFDICEGWAVKCGFFTPKAARPDLYRAANNILRLAVSGQLRLCFKPPLFKHTLDAVMLDPETDALHILLKSRHITSKCIQEEVSPSNDDDDDDEDDDNDDNESKDDKELIDATKGLC